MQPTPIPRSTPPVPDAHCVPDPMGHTTHRVFHPRSVVAALLALTAGAMLPAQVLLTEDFSASILNTYAWAVVTQGVPFGGTAVLVQNQACILQNRGHLVTTQEFDAGLLGGYQVRCQWRWTDAYDRFQLLLRSDGVPGGTHGETLNGIELIAGMEGTSNAGIGARGGLIQIGPMTTTGPGVTFAVGTNYVAEMWDLGTSVGARIEGPGGQWWRFEVPVLQDNAGFRRVVLHNREQMMGSHQCVVDDISVVLPCEWMQVATATSPAPSASIGCGMTFDETMGRVLLFGGHSDGQAHDSTWAFDGASWQQLWPTSRPSPRSTAMTYDSTRNRGVLFGGWDNVTRLQDLWEWDGVNWQHRTPAVSPPGRDSHQMTFDRARGRVVLFGGRGVSTTPQVDTPLCDTWEWDGIAWYAGTSTINPPGRWEASMAFDEVHGVTVLTGGADNSGTRPADTWFWSGTQWSQATPPSLPPARHGAGMAYDVTSRRVVLFGGLGTSGYLNDTWEWDGSVWQQRQQQAAPQGRGSTQLAYDRIRTTTVMHGGIAAPGSGTPSSWLQDTWHNVPAVSASYTTFGAGCPGPGSVPPALSGMPGFPPILGATTVLQVTNLPTSGLFLPLLGIGFTNTVASGPFGPYPLPFDLTFLGWPNCQQLVSIVDLAVPSSVLGSGTASLNIWLPPFPFLAGRSFYAQALVLHDQAGASMSNGIHGTVGY